MRSSVAITTTLHPYKSTERSWPAPEDPDELPLASSLSSRIMKNVQSYLAVLPLVLIICVKTGVYATSCYVCNTASHYKHASLCEDPFDKVKAKEAGLYKDCDPLSQQTGMNFTYCRKMTQNVEGENRLLRQCASHVRVDRCIERTGTKDIKLKYCDCEGEGCNAAPPMLAINLILMFTVSALLALLFHS